MMLLSVTAFLPNDLLQWRRLETDNIKLSSTISSVSFINKVNGIFPAYLSLLEKDLIYPSSNVPLRAGFSKGWLTN